MLSVQQDHNTSKNKELRRLRNLSYRTDVFFAMTVEITSLIKCQMSSSISILEDMKEEKADVSHEREKREIRGRRRRFARAQRRSGKTKTTKTETSNSSVRSIALGFSVYTEGS